jgi:hypothetical protein
MEDVVAGVMVISQQWNGGMEKSNNYFGRGDRSPYWFSEPGCPECEIGVLPLDCETRFNKERINEKTRQAIL